MEQKQIYPKISDKTIDGVIRQIIVSKDGTRKALKIKTDNGIIVEWFNAGFLPNEISLGDEVSLTFETRIAGVSGFSNNGEWTLHGLNAIEAGSKKLGDTYDAVSDITVFDMSTIAFEKRKRNLMSITDTEVDKLRKLGANITL